MLCFNKTVLRFDKLLLCLDNTVLCLEKCLLCSKSILLCFKNCLLCLQTVGHRTLECSPNFPPAQYLDIRTRTLNYFFYNIIKSSQELEV